MAKLPRDEAARLEIGRKVHERAAGVRVGVIAAEYGLSEKQAYGPLKEYRRSIGITSNAAIARLRRRAPKVANGNGGSHVVAIAPEQGHRVVELERQLAEAMEEVHTLQKILMVVGRTL